MKKYLIIGITLIILLVIGIILFVNRDSSTYIVKVNLVDEKSPDRILKIYRDNQEIDYKEIRKMNGLLLCESDNSSIYYGEIKNETKDAIKYKVITVLGMSFYIKPVPKSPKVTCVSVKV